MCCFFYLGNNLAQQQYTYIVEKYSSRYFYLLMVDSMIIIYSTVRVCTARPAESSACVPLARVLSHLYHYLLTYLHTYTHVGIPTWWRERASECSAFFFFLPLLVLYSLTLAFAAARRGIQCGSSSSGLCASSVYIKQLYSARCAPVVYLTCACSRKTEEPSELLCILIIQPSSSQHGSCL